MLMMNDEVEDEVKNVEEEDSGRVSYRGLNRFYSNLLIDIFIAINI